MSAPARLLALRVQGFKSFAEKTLVEFGPGISAVVGPNGSGKSNLADGLRWALGEQGRALRTRRSEDVIFAGSERRAALGMADVTLVLDNADGLLPLEFGTVELGRRLYRSGENDYLLNRQRIRLRDLVDLLDAAHLADNAFLFIGQGMVDQALALRPEERRPLFEEVAGVRRHERRRRRAEEQLTESEANLARIDDILAELRPQARRLAAQAEQQATRLTAGDDLAGAIVASAHARWHAAAGRVAAATTTGVRARREADRAMEALTEAERTVGGIAAQLGRRAVAQEERLAANEATRSRSVELQLRQARLESDLASAARDRQRLAAERAAAEADAATQRRSVATASVPPRDLDAEAALADAERALAEALGELGALRAARVAQGERQAALRRAETARQAELETARRRCADAERRADEARSQAATGAERRTELEAGVAAAHAALAAAIAGETAAAAAREEARREADGAEAVRRAAAEGAAQAAEGLAALAGRADALEARLAEDETRGIARAARKLGGRRVDEGLQVEPTLRAAVEAALGDAARGYRVGRAAAVDLGAERGVVVVDERLAEPRGRASAGGREEAFVGRIDTLGGGRLVDAVRRDDVGAVRRLLERSVWLPDLASALEVQAELPPGWIAVARDGSAVVTSLAVTLGRSDAPLERRAEAARLHGEREAAAAKLADLVASREAGERDADDARDRLAEARAAESRAAAGRRTAEEAERVSARGLEAALREAAWLDAQAERLGTEAVGARATLEQLSDDGEATARTTSPDDATDGLVGTSRAAGSARSGGAPGAGDEMSEVTAESTWEDRAAELRARRDRLAAQLAEQETARRDAEARRTRAEAAVAAAEERMARADRDIAALSEQERAAAADRDALAAELAHVAEDESRTRAALDEVRAADAQDRSRLAAAETEASTARERLRATDERLRAADVGEMEARLALDAVRESVLVELAGIGEPGARRLAGAAGIVEHDGTAVVEDPSREPDDAAATADDQFDDGSTDDDQSADVARLERLLDAVGPTWAAEPPGIEAPSPGRLAALRRRYHELGAANPFAVEEYAALRTRLESLDTQATDLRSAIARTRSLIEELNQLIADQFRTTFRALEAAFDRRFGQLFGGGFAKLSLTDPTDLSATGVEIVARPPGKKAQSLSMLSGGERALTAVALLFAMLEVRPVPFCVLDEVDAALDEANVGRFTEALRELAERTQCIVITHNRGTIEAADALYGVTVGDDSVSRVISLRLEEAQAIADRARRSDRIAAG